MHGPKALVGAVVVAVGSIGVAAAAVSEGTLAVQVCGRLVEHTPATASANGRLVIGTRTNAVAAGTVAGNAGVQITPGRELCVQGSAGRTSGQLLRYLFFPMPPGTTCGTALANVGTTVNLRADFGLLRIARQEGVREPRRGERVCYVAAVSADGDLVATREDPVDTTIEREWVEHCGTVKTYRPATATADGAIAVGSETFAIARGTAYTGDPAGDRTDRTTVGQNMCLRGVRGEDLKLIEYATTAMRTSIGGQASEYVPPTDANAGIATLSFRSQLRLRIPAAIDAAADIARTTNCYSVGVDAIGNMSATTLIPCSPGVAAGPLATPSPAAPAPPSPLPTVAAPTASATATPSGAPLAAPSSSSAAPTASPDTTTPASPLLLGIALLVALAAVLAIVARTRRGGGAV